MKTVQKNLFFLFFTINAIVASTHGMHRIAHQSRHYLTHQSTIRKTRTVKKITSQHNRSYVMQSDNGTKLAIAKPPIKSHIQSHIKLNTSWHTYLTDLVLGVVIYCGLCQESDADSDTEDVKKEENRWTREEQDILDLWEIIKSEARVSLSDETTDLLCQKMTDYLAQYLAENDIEHMRDFFHYFLRTPAWSLLDVCGIYYLKRILRFNPAITKKIRPLLIEQATFLLTSWNGIECLEQLLIQDKTAAKELSVIAEEEFETILHAYCGCFFLYTLFDANPDLAKNEKLINGIQDYYENLLNSHDGEKLVARFVNANNGMLREWLPKIIVQDFKKIIMTQFGCSFLRKLVESDCKEIMDLMLPQVKKHFEFMITYGRTGLLQPVLIHSGNGAAKELIDKSKCYIKELLGSDNGYRFLRALVVTDFNIAKQLIPSKQAYKKLINEKYGTEFYAYLKEKYPKEMHALMLEMLKDDQFTFGLLELLLKSRCDQEVEAIIQEQIKNDTMDATLKLLTYMSQCKKSSLLNIKTGLDDSDSYKHLKKHYHAAVLATADNKIKQAMGDDKNVKNMIYAMMKNEKKLDEEGFQIFYHGQRLCYGIVEDFFTKLMALKNGMHYDNFLFTHVKIVPKTYQERFNEWWLRISLARNGNQYHSQNDPRGVANREKLLFMNLFLAGNCTGWGSSSLSYMLHNQNAGYIGLSLKDAFDRIPEYTHLYNKYADELKDLEREYNKLSQYGQLLQIAVPKKRLAGCVYLTCSGGRRQSIDIPGIGKTTNIEQIVEHLKKTHDDRREFALINTSVGGGLDPNIGIQIKAFNAADPAKWVAYQEKQNRILKKIETDILLAKTMSNQCNELKDKHAVSFDNIMYAIL